MSPFKEGETTDTSITSQQQKDQAQSERQIPVGGSARSGRNRQLCHLNHLTPKGPRQKKKKKMACETSEGSFTE